MRKSLTKIFWNIEVWAVQKHVNLVDLVKSFPTNIYLQNLASIQPRTSPLKFAHLVEKSESALRYRTFVWFFSQMSKLYRARSLLYRRQILQKKYSLESSWQDLQDVHAFAPLRPQYFRKKSSNFFAFFCKILQKY